MQYCQATFSRGSGLGNRLFPWARCTIFSEINSIPMISPQWGHIRSGPLRKGGVNLLNYHRQILLWDLFKKDSKYISGFQKACIKSLANRISEPNIITDKLSCDFQSSSSIIHVFSGDGGHFTPLIGYESFLQDKFLSISKNKWINIVNNFNDVKIAINIRRGKDFKDATSPEEFKKGGVYRTPLSWFIETLESVRKIAGYPINAYVISDGTREDLHEILKKQNVFFVRPGCAASDLLILSKSKILIAPGNSSFSAWASFFGQMPTLTPPGQSLQWFGLGNRSQCVEEFDPCKISDNVINQLNLALNT